MADKGDMAQLNKALRETVVLNRETAEYPLHVRYTKKGDNTHFKHRTKNLDYNSASAALQYCLAHPDIRIACIFDSKGRPVA